MWTAWQQFLVSLTDFQSLQAEGQDKRHLHWFLTTTNQSLEGLIYCKSFSRQLEEEQASLSTLDSGFDSVEVCLLEVLSGEAVFADVAVLACGHTSGSFRGCGVLMFL